MSALVITGSELNAPAGHPGDISDNPSTRGYADGYGDVSPADKNDHGNSDPIWASILDGLNADALQKSPRYRRAVTRYEPLLFALTYFPGHLKSAETGNVISLSQFHLDLCEHAKQWCRADIGPAEIREAWVAPRGSGKSTWIFVILALWALAHRHRKYISAFADSASQAEQHLTSVKAELDGNALLRMDYPGLCEPETRPTGVKVADHRSMYVAKTGVVFTAKGIDSSVLGAKVRSQRPDLLLFDDIEPDASNYSPYQKDKRLATILNAILPMNDRAVVQFVGTVTMPGSVIHDLVKTVQHPDQPAAQWVTDEKVRTYSYPALVIDPETGAQRSSWPQRWSLAYLQGIAHTRSFRLNLQNDPMAADGAFWSDTDFTYGELDNLTGQVLSIDPAVTTNEKSDFTALAVVACSKPQRKCVVRAAWAVKIAPGAPLKDRVLQILAMYPDTVGILVESNQGGQAWENILADVPVPVRLIHNKVNKGVRAARLLNHYQHGRVQHERPLPDVEAQMIAFPKAPNDDLIDAVGNAVAAFLDRDTRRAGATSVSYLDEENAA